ncbi:hypothetical protein GC194_11045 [bacterium]|nr:hypothetical protein [bacterium]
MAAKSTDNLSQDQSFIEFMDSIRPQIEGKIRDGFVPTDVVIDAYRKGKEAGKEELLNELVEKNTNSFLEKALLAYYSAIQVIRGAQKNGFSVNSMYANLFKRTPHFLLVVEDELMLNDEFTKLVYELIADKVTEFRSKYQDLFDIGLVTRENLDEETLKSDGYIYYESAKEFRAGKA